MTPSWHPDHLAARMPFLRRRARLAAAVRAFFDARGYVEVETPYAVTAPGEDVHLSAFATEQIGTDGTRRQVWLHTSPEFAMKRLLVGGAGNIFQLARVWRNGEGSARHAAEFTMLEWYRPHASMSDLMDETESLLRAVLPPLVTSQGLTADLTPPFQRITMEDAFAQHAGADLLGTEGDAAALAASAGERLREGEDWEDLFFRLLLARIEPAIGTGPVFLTHWPAAQAALARRDPADPRVAERFELYVCGLELANAFVELTDAAEQRARFIADRARRHALYGGPDWDLDEDFLAALAHGMPQAAGIAMGFDRLAMLASGADRIDQVLWLP